MRALINCQKRSTLMQQLITVSGGVLKATAYGNKIKIAKPTQAGQSKKKKEKKKKKKQLNIHGKAWHGMACNL